MNVVDRETSEIKILSVGVILFKKLISAILDEDFGDITDVETGHDFKIIMYKEGQWPKYDQSQPRPKSEPAGSSAEVAAWMEQLHDIQSLVKLEDYEELKNVSESLAVKGTIEAVVTREQTPAPTTDEYLNKLKAN